tara:strand:+ start:4276 stop:4410 length:135 start_codon:yes stop_codon:yes gene_type:complete
MARLVVTAYKKPAKRKRPGVHAKTKTSNVKGSKFYLKKYKGQGR